MHLGLLSFGQAQDEAPDLGMARHFIDLLAMLSEKTRGNLALDEQRLVENSLTELRFRYVQASESESKDKPEDKAQESGEPSAVTEPQAEA